MKHLAAAACALVVMAGVPPAAAQLADLQPGRNFVAEPSFGSGSSQNIDVGDADLDGDLDAIVANGGDSVPALSRIFINDGLGSFTDETGTRFAGLPADRSRDIEFVDLENDGDLDVFVANTNPPGAGGISRFHVNLGGLQSGSVGFFQEETNARWGTLVSVPLSSQVFGGNAGPFREWSGDADFADLDDDGDLDLFFCSYGPFFDGSRDSRVFLNDGAGVFDELWPWADPAADTKTKNQDTDLADCDGDFDLDILMSDRGTQARVYVNNLFGPLGNAPFKDITPVALLATGALQTGSTNYEVEYADLDGDLDFDAWMVNYNGNLERILRNDGSVAGGFQFTRMNPWIQGDPSVGDGEVDFGDFDNDDDLDAFVASWGSSERLYQSSLSQGLNPDIQGLYHRTGLATGQAPVPEMPVDSEFGYSLDGEWADLDGDHDLDILIVSGFNRGNALLRNVLGVPDTHAPKFLGLTVQSNKPNGSPTVIHARLQDNAPFYLHQFYDAQLVYSIDGGAEQSVSMFAQGGQQYRGVIPAQSNATVTYHVEVTDLNGNTGVSTTHGFEQGDPAVWEDLGSGLAGIAGVPSLVGAGPLTAGSAGALTLSSAAPSAICALFISVASTPAPFKCGTLVPVPVAIQITLATNGSGSLPLTWVSWPSGLSGASLWFQYAIADGAAVCGTALSNALRADVP